jgi:RNA polymerase sigma factor (sigma-70 family)
MTDDDRGSHRSRFGSFWVKTLEDSNERLKSYARRLANGRAYDVEDLLQETICRALTYSPDPREIKSPLSYLLRMMRNSWIDRWKKENSANVESLEDLLNSGQHPTVEPVVQRMLESRELQHEMAAKQGPLTPREKLLLELYLKGLKCQDIADRLDENVRLTRSDLNAVKAKVRYRLMKARAKATASGRP